MHAGQSMTRYLAVIDNRDDKDFQKALERAIAHCRKTGYDELRRVMRPNGPPTSIRAPFRFPTKAFRSSTT